MKKIFVALMLLLCTSVYAQTRVISVSSKETLAFTEKNTRDSDYNDYIVSGVYPFENGWIIELRYFVSEKMTGNDYITLKFFVGKEPVVFYTYRIDMSDKITVYAMKVVDVKENSFTVEYTAASEPIQYLNFHKTRY